MSQPRRTYTDEQILQMLRDCKEEYGACSPRNFKKLDDTCSVTLVTRRFGSWSDAKDKAGIDEDLMSSNTGREKEYSDEKILSHLRECFRTEVTDDDGEVLFEDDSCTVEKLQACDGLVAPSVAVTRFGSWIDAKREAGIKPDERGNSREGARKWSDEDYLDLMRECEEKHGKVTQRKFNELSKESDDHPSAGAVRKRFEDDESEKGGWQIAKEKAGVAGESTRYTTEELLEDLRECERRYGTASASRFAADQDFCSPETLQRRFGSWSAAKKEAGVE